MDFLKEMKAKLEELEREAQRAMQEQHQQQQALFQAKKGKGDQGRQKQPQKQKQKQKSRGGGRQAQPQQTRSSRMPVDSEVCPVEEATARSIQSGRPFQAGDSIMDDLAGRLEEAFLLQEVLGPPRCVRGWDD